VIVWLADVLRRAGLDVVEMHGWQTRTRSGGFDPQGIVWHHTATPPSASDTNVDRLLRDGRTGLPGPLSQLGLRRDGTFVVVAAGRCNHNGYGTWGNDSIGIEAYNDGVGEPWPTAQVDAYVAGTVAILRHLGWGADRVKAHRETDPTRKVDPRGIDMNAARGRITAALTQEDDMTPEQERKLDEALGLLRALVPNTPRKVVTTGSSVGTVSDAGKPAAELWRWGLESLFRTRALDPSTLAQQIAERLPAASGPVKVADLEQALRNVFGSLDE